MNDIIEVSYTGDLLAHRRCSRAWAYEKHVGFHPYEQVQAMEGRLIHHAMEWLTRKFVEANGRTSHASLGETREQLEKHFRVLWSRGIRTTFASKQETIERVLRNLFPGGMMHATVRIVVEGAQHTEYELRSVRKLIGTTPGRKKKVLLTGVLDLVVQQSSPLVYPAIFRWTDRETLEGTVIQEPLSARAGDVEIWDYKGTRATTGHLTDYARQLLTYAYLYHERTGQMPARCVLYFVNEGERRNHLLAVELDDELITRAVAWTHQQVDELQDTIAEYQRTPKAILGGERVLLARAPLGARVTNDLRKQCTACGLRFDCSEYQAHLGAPNHPDLSRTDVHKN